MKVYLIIMLIFFVISFIAKFIFLCVDDYPRKPEEVYIYEDVLSLLFKMGFIIWTIFLLGMIKL